MKTQNYGRPISYGASPIRVGLCEQLCASHLVGYALRNYRNNRENGVSQDDNQLEPFPSYGLENITNYSDFDEKFDWEPDRERGYPDRAENNRYWFTIIYKKTGARITGFSQEADYEKGFPKEEDGQYYYYINFTDTECPAIREWMQKKDLNYLDRIQKENSESYEKEIADLQRQNDPNGILLKHKARQDKYAVITSGDKKSEQATNLSPKEQQIPLAATTDTIMPMPALKGKELPPTLNKQPEIIPETPKPASFGSSSSSSYGNMAILSSSSFFPDASLCKKGTGKSREEEESKYDRNVASSNILFEKATLISRKERQKPTFNVPRTPPSSITPVMSEEEYKDIEKKHRYIGRLGERKVYDRLKEHYRKKYCNHPQATMNDDFFDPNDDCNKGFKINGFDKDGKPVNLCVIWYNKGLSPDQDWMKDHDIKIIKNGEERFIEIKTTDSKDNKKITLTSAEWELMSTVGERYRIFRVFDVNAEPLPPIKKIKNPAEKLKSKEITVEKVTVSLNFK